MNAKTAERDKRLIARYLELQAMNRRGVRKTLTKEFNLSYTRVWQLVKRWEWEKKVTLPKLRLGVPGKEEQSCA